MASGKLKLFVTYKSFNFQGSRYCNSSGTCGCGSFKPNKGMEWTEFESARPVRSVFSITFCPVVVEFINKKITRYGKLMA